MEWIAYIALTLAFITIIGAMIIDYKANGISGSWVKQDGTIIEWSNGQCWIYRPNGIIDHWTGDKWTTLKDQ